MKIYLGGKNRKLFGLIIQVAHQNSRNVQVSSFENADSGVS